MMMRTLLLLTSDTELSRMVSGAVPEGWRVQKASVSGQAMRLVEQEVPDLLCVDLALQGSDGLAFLQAVRERLSPAPAAVLCMPSAPDASTVDAAATLNVENRLSRPLSPEDVSEVLGGLFESLSPPAMTLLEFLGEGFSDMAVRQTHLSAEGTEISFLFGGGHLWAIRHPDFAARYHQALAAAGIEHEDARTEDSWIGLAEFEESVRSSTGLSEAKKGTVLSVLSECPLRARFDARVGDVIIPEGLVPVDIPSLLLELVGRVPAEVLAPLRNPALRVVRAGDVIPEDLAIRPEHGYILSQCSEARAPAELIQMGILPDGVILEGLYLLLLLGLLVSRPSAPGPFRIEGLKEVLDSENLKVRRQSEAIQSLLRSFQLPGQNPYDILGVDKGTSLSAALEAYEAMQSRLSSENLHPEVYRTLHKDILFLQAKLSEAYLLIESGFIESRKSRDRDEAEASDASKAAGGGQPSESEALRKRQADALYARAVALMEEDQVFEASQCLKLALFHDPDRAEGQNLMARIHERNPSTKSKHLAEQAYQQAYRLDPGNIDYILDLAEFYAKHGLVARCRSYLDKAQAIELRHPRALEIRKAIKGKG